MIDESMVASERMLVITDVNHTLAGDCINGNNRLTIEVSNDVFGPTFAEWLVVRMVAGLTCYLT